MNTKIAILRGINVGGKRKMQMASLKSLCEELGWENVSSYIQSGNIIFNSASVNAELEKELEKAIFEEFGFYVPVIVRNSKELRTAIEQNPFSKTSEISQLHLTFLKEKPSKENEEKIRTYTYEPDKFKIVNREIFLLCKGKYHQSKLSNTFFETKLKLGATTRNWKTVLKLAELAENKQ